MIVIGHLNQSDAGHWSEIKEDNDCSLDSKRQSNAFYCTLVSKKEDNDCR